MSASESESSSGEEETPQNQSSADEGETSPKNIPFHNTRDQEFERKYNNLKGKSLFVLFPHKLPVNIENVEKKVKALCDRVIKVRRPRQKSTRFCLVDFANAEDRDEARKILKSVEINGKKLRAEIPKTESEDYIKDLLEKRKEKRDEKRASNKLKKSVKRADKIKTTKNYTSSLLIRNIPANTSTNDLKEHFPDAVQLRVMFPHGKEETSSAIVTLATPKDATRVKRSKIKIGENPLNISFAPPEKRTDSKSSTNIKEEEEGEVASKVKDNKPKKGMKRPLIANPIVDSDETESVKPKIKKKSKKPKKSDEATVTPTKKCKKSKGNKEHNDVPEDITEDAAEKPQNKKKNKNFGKQKPGGKGGTFQKNFKGKQFGKNVKSAKQFKK